MSRTTVYDGGTLTRVLPSSVSWAEDAHLGEVGSGQFIYEDVSGSQTFVGLKTVTDTESLAPANNQRICTGYVVDKEYARGEHYEIGADRQILVTVVDVNDLLGRRLIIGVDGKRSRETISDRLTWLLGSSYVAFSDLGLVVYPSRYMDATDYRSQTAGAVLADCAEIAGFNYFLYYSEASAAVGLFFDNSNVSTAYSTAYQISNAPGDADGSTTFAPFQAAQLRRDPLNIASLAYVSYNRGNVIREKTSTATTFASRDVVVSSSSAQTLQQANRLGDRFLNDHDTEDDVINVKIRVLPAQVNAIRAGHRLQVKFTHLPGYESYSYVRVLRRTVRLPFDHDNVYEVEFDLSPMALAPCASPVEINRSHGTVAGSVAAESGSPMWAHATISGWFGGPVDTAVSTVPVYNPSYANDSDAATFSYVNGQVFRYSGSVAVYWTSTLDTTYTICTIKGTNAVGNNSWRSRQPDRIDYWDDTTGSWIALAGRYTYAPSTPTPQYWTFTLNVGVATTKVRLVYVQTSTSLGPASLWAWMSLGVRVYDWLIYGN